LKLMISAMPALIRTAYAPSMHQFGEEIKLHKRHSRAPSPAGDFHPARLVLAPRP
jgi:hypothetical protein